MFQWLVVIFIIFTGYCHPYTKEVLSESPRIVLLPDFLSSEECDYLIAFARPYLFPSQVVDDTQANSSILDYRRTSKGMFLPQFSPDNTIRSIEERISLLTAIPLEHGEGIQVLHYTVGGEYVPHFDYFNPLTPGG